MKVTERDGRHFLVGKPAEVGRVLLGMSKKAEAPGVGWTLDAMADEASVLEGRRYRCEDCSCERQELEFGRGSCPECGGARLSRSA